MSNRLLSAAREGLLDWPEGPVLAMRVGAASAPALLETLSTEQVSLVHGFAPEVSAWAGYGISAQIDYGTDFAASLTALPRSRDYGKVLVARAIAATQPGGLVLVDGQKTDGIEPMLKALRQHLECEVFSKAHGKLIIARRPDTLPGAIAKWAELTPNAPKGWHTALAGFSPNAIDAGSAQLVAHLPDLSGAVVDLGAGWGYLSRAILAQPKVKTLDLVEAEHDTLEAARRNITDPRARFHWTDALTFGPKRSFDTVVMNPPFHTGRAAEPALGQAFIAAAANLLRPKGQLVLVANRHLPYEGDLAQRFVQIEVLAQDNGFKTLLARVPKRAT